MSGQLRLVVWTNSYEPEVIEITVTKNWEDEDDHDGLRPASVTMRLTADGSEIAVVSLNEVDGWTYTFKNLPKYANGKLIDYELTEDEVEHYTTEDIEGIIEEVDENSYEIEIENTHEPEKTMATIVKVWEDEEDALGLRPERVTFTLYKNNPVGGAVGPALLRSCESRTSLKYSGSFPLFSKEIKLPVRLRTIFHKKAFAQISKTMTSGFFSSI